MFQRWTVPACLALVVLAGESQAQFYGRMSGRTYGSYPGYYSQQITDYYGSGYRPGFGYPAYLATPYSTWYNYYPEPYRYPQYGLFAPARMYADPYVSPYGPRFSRQGPVLEMSPLPRVASNAALIQVSVPANAEVLFDGAKTTQTGASRLFETPELEPGKEFQYEVTARWQQEGKEVEQKRNVTVRAGGRAQVAFEPAPAKGS